MDIGSSVLILQTKLIFNTHYFQHFHTVANVIPYFFLEKFPSIF
ncbi:hypothetical protein dsmv_3596 [Desulfococcus multivorans DSM 2059]|uniref:Uncharacterized protein n=1 Tax=Desulfococcus multivorans DSM 2059 TaxID=1121405 RepID=S7T879_DESML|nr:hypothetical protein dsmv_3596 [Desulfococcus multivorans DSM 2059]SKA26454.1 hypothetical protein SAMN02745446_03628 [Desulfococcus multivorans DSM 2059]